MRNKYSGKCYYCGEHVAKGDGHFERHNKSWRVIHAECVHKQRAQKQDKKLVINDMKNN